MALALLPIISSRGRTLQHFLLVVSLLETLLAGCGGGGQLEQEAPWELEFRPPPDWPNNGMIALSNVNFKYSSDGPLVLKDLTTDIKPGEKVCLSHLPL